MNLGFRTKVGPESFDGIVGDQPRYIAIRIMQISTHQRTGTYAAARLDTCRHPAGIQTVSTEVTGFSDAMRPLRKLLVVPFMIILEVEQPGIVWTRNHAVSATDTTVMVHYHDTIIALVCRPHRANLRAGRFLTVVAHQQDILLLWIIFISRLDLDFSYPMDVPSLIAMESDIVLVPASLHAGVAVLPALVEVDQHSPLSSGEWITFHAEVCAGRDEESEGIGARYTRDQRPSEYLYEISSIHLTSPFRRHSLAYG